MKRFLLAMAFVVSFGFTLDTSKTEMYWEGYKFANKTAVKGSFADVKYKFGNKEGIGGKLLGASAVIDLAKVTTGNPASEENLTKEFFGQFESRGKNNNIRVKLEQVIEGENQGTILAKISMNKKTQLIPMQYTITDGKLIAKGVIDVFSFNLGKAFENLSQICKNLHKGHTWSQVEIGFTIPMQ